MTQVFFSPTADYCSAIDIVRPDGRGAYSGKTLEQIREEHPDVQVAHIDVSVQHDRNRRMTLPSEITKERFWELLECLPPCKWRRSPSAEAFHISERITYDIVTWCVRIGESYYTFDDSDKLTAGDAIQKVAVDHFKEAAL